MNRLPVIFLILAAFALPASGVATQKAATVTESEKLIQIVEDYFEEQLKLHPVQATSIGDNRYNDRFTNSISPEFISHAEAIERQYLQKVNSIQPELLKAQDLLSYEIFKRDRELALKELRFPSHLLPVNQSYSVPTGFAQLGSGEGEHPFKTVKDYEDFLKRIDGFVEWMKQAIVNMREGIKKGYVQPAVLMEKFVPQLESHLVSSPEKSIFWGPVRNFPGTFNAAEKERLEKAYREAIIRKIIPAYRSLNDFIKNDYLKNARRTIGLSGLPDGVAWYDLAVKILTTTDLTSEQIHQIGLEEVKRIHEEMKKVMVEVEFQGNLKDFFRYVNEDPIFYYTKQEDLLNGYRELKQRIAPSLAKLFDVMPKADYEVRAVEEFREKSASGGSYQNATLDGSRPGIFYVNTYDLTARPIWAMEALSLHEASPGHHFQISIQQELEGLPRFRRFSGYGAYVEGWGLYAESLGRELGVYENPYQYFGSLNAELWRSIRLVVDTGIHAKGWTREDVLKYMYENSAVREARAVSEAERYIAAPGQALGYKIGQMKIRELRTRAEKTLGKKFDVRKFHNAILVDGALPLDVLEKKIGRWITEQQK